MAENDKTVFGVIALVLAIWFLSSRASAGTQAIGSGFNVGAFLSTTPGLIVGLVLGVIFVVVLFVPKEK